MSDCRNLLITGATGFIGRDITREACRVGFHVSVMVRSHTEIMPAAVNQIVVGDLQQFTKEEAITLESNRLLLSAMQNVDVVIHTAARAHVMREEHDDPAAIYHLMNVALTEKLALAAADAGVKRFVFISSIKVNGEASTEPFTEADVPAPEDDYGRSKWLAEQCLTEIGQRTGMEIVILRPPLIYGPGVKGNFASLIKLIRKSIPLPFGAIHNKRSLLALDNLVSAILLVSEHPAAANQAFLLADDEDVSTTELIKLIAQSQGKKARLIPVPVSWMTFAARLFGKKSVADRLFGSLQIDASKIRQTLGWKPVITMPRQLAKIFSDVDSV